MTIVGSGVRRRSYASRGLPDRWLGWVEYDRRRGETKRPRVTTERATEREALAWVRYKIAEHATAPQSARAGGRETVGALLEDYYRHGVDVAAWSIRHRAVTRRAIDHYLKPLHHLRVADLLVEDVDELVAGLRRDRVSPHVIRRVRDALRAAFNYGIDRRRIPQGHNPAALADIPKVTRRPPKFIAPDQLGAFVAAVEHDWLGPLFVTSALLALRPSEAIGLRWSDVDLEAGTVAIHRTVQREPGKWKKGDGKKGAGGRYVEGPTKTHQERVLNIGPDLVALLEQHRRATREEIGHGWQPEDVVFPSPAGGYVYEDGANRRLKKLLAEAGLQPVTFYQLRHTGGTLRQFLGVPLGAIQEEMGHSSIAMTRRYAQVVESMKKGSADAVDAAFKAARQANSAPSGGTSGGTTPPTPLRRRRATPETRSVAGE